MANKLDGVSDNNLPPKVDPWLRSTSQSPQEQLRDLYLRYLYQLLIGCSRPQCSQVLCHTGRVNSSASPVRKYNLRSASAIALTICSGPQPWKHLCPYGGGRDHPNAVSINKQPGPQDPSSLMQLITDSVSVAQYTASQFAVAHELEPQHSHLDYILACTEPSGDRTMLMSNSQLVESIVPCLQWLMGRLAAHRTTLWDIPGAYEMVGPDINGSEAPSSAANRSARSIYTSLLVLQDVMDHEIHLRFLRRIVTIIAKRLRFEHELDSIRAQREREDEIAKEVPFRKSIAECFVAEWFELHSKDPIKQVALVIWLKKLFTQCWNDTPDVLIGTVPHAILRVFEQMSISPQLRSILGLRLPIIQERVGEVDLATSWLAVRKQSHCHLFEFPFVFSDSEMYRYFRTINHIRMRAAHSAALSAYALKDKVGVHLTSAHDPAQLHHEEQHYLVLYVSRRNIVKDTFDQIWQRRKGELRRPLRVRMGADDLDIGHDLGGVQVEFFQVFCRKVFEEEAQMFTTNPETGLSYFRACSLQPLHMFELFGTLLALALFNGITLPIRLPQMFYRMIVEFPNGSMVSPRQMVDNIRDGWPSEARSLSAILEHDIDDLEFAFPLEAEGIRMTVLHPMDTPRRGLPRPSARRIPMKVIDASRVDQHSGGSQSLSEEISDLALSWPGWKMIESNEQARAVTRENKAEYVCLYAEWLFCLSVAPQIGSVLTGFSRSELVDSQTLKMLGARNLKSLVEGTDHLDIEELKEAARYDGYEAKSKYMRSFWSIVMQWPEQKQKQLLKFVTAAERIPITGAKNLTFIIKRYNPESLDSLPTSSTCFGTLMLPRYGSAEVLAAKLDLALKYGAEGFGTG